MSINPDNNTLVTSAGEVTYDYLVIANGTKSNFFGNDKIEKLVIPLKTVHDSLNIRSHLMQLFEWANLVTDNSIKEKMLDVVIVGGGPHRRRNGRSFGRIKKIHFTERLSSSRLFGYEDLSFGRHGQALTANVSHSQCQCTKKTGAYGVIIKLNAMVHSYDGEVITLKSGEQIKSLTVLWSAGVTGDMIPGLKQEWIEKSRLLTDEYCQVKGAQNIFAIGDIALMKTDLYPKGHPGLAQPAIQMGKYIGRYLNGLQLPTGNPTKPFKYTDKGSLATIGRGKAVADLPGNIHLTGRIAWWIWVFVHITFLISFRNKLLVMTNWLWNYFTFDKGNRLIIRPYTRKDTSIISAEQLIRGVDS